MTQPVFSGGAWWAQRADGSWLRWNQAASAWEPYPDAGTSDPAATPPATPPVGPGQVPTYQAPVYPTYGQVPPPAYGAPAPASTNGLAVASLVLGIIWVYWIGSVLAVIFGLVAMKQIKESGGRQGGKGLAIAGFTLGVVWLGLGLIGLIASFVDL